jgi:hypothetical protein
MQTEGNASKNGGQVFYPSQPYFRTLGNFGEEFLRKEQCDNSGASPLLS